MSILKKIKEKILSLSNSYLFYKNYYQQNNNLQDICQKLVDIEDKMDSNYIRFDESLNHNALEINNNLNNRIDDVKINQNIQNYNFVDFFEKKISSLEQNNLDHIDEYMFNIEDIFEKSKKSNEKTYNDILKECSYISNKIQRDNRILYDMVGNDFEKLDFNQKSFENVVSDKIDNLNDSFLSINKTSDENTKELLSRINYLENILNDNQKSFENIVSDKIDNLNDSFLSINKISDENTKELLSRLNTLEKTFTTPMSILDIKKAIMTTNEIKYGLIFKDTSIDSTWFKDKNLSLNNSAANYSFIYLLYRVLNENKPKNILEFGLGQTSKLTIQYANHFNNTSLQIIEDNQDWIDTFLENYNLNRNISVNQCDLEEFEYNNSKNLRYKNLDKIIKNKKFDLIIIDGPRGWLQKTPLEFQEYPRSNIWDLISGNLSEDFIIIFDDYDRTGEQNTSKITGDLLTEQDIKVYSQEFKGSKNQLLICSEKNRFSTWY